MPNETDEQRERRAHELADERVRDAINTAFEQGRRQEKVDGRLNSHEARLNAINGSIARAARETSDLRASVDTLTEQIQTKNAVKTALHKEVEKANAKQISNRTFLLGVLSILAMILAGTLGPHLIG